MPAQSGRLFCCAHVWAIELRPHPRRRFPAAHASRHQLRRNDPTPMKARLRSNSVSGAIEQVAVGIGFLVFYGILIRQVGADAVGVLSLVMIVTTVASFGNAGFASALSHFVPIFESRGDRTATVQCIETTMACTVALYMLMLGAAYFPVLALVQAQVGPTYSAMAGELMLPVAIYAVLLGAGSASSLALTALQRNDLRAWVSVGAVVTNLVTALWAAPRLGVVGGAWALVAQAGVTLVGSWLSLRHMLPELAALPFRPSFSMARQMFGLGANMQAQTILASSAEPVARLLMAQFGPLALVTYFSMASRFVVQVRTLIYACSQPLLAAFSHARHADPHEFLVLYKRAHLMLTFSGVGLMSAAVGASPFVGEMWIGERQNAFVMYTAVLACGWTANITVLASYFNSYSLGIMKWNLIGHLILAGATAIACYILGVIFGPLGVVSGASLALIISALVFESGNSSLISTRMRYLLPDDFAFLAGSGAAAAGAVWIYATLRPMGTAPLMAGMASGLIWAIVFTLAALTHPEGQRALSILWRRGWSSISGKRST